jgi:hypothetical protein
VPEFGLPNTNPILPISPCLHLDFILDETLTKIHPNS